MTDYFCTHMFGFLNGDQLVLILATASPIYPQHLYTLALRARN